MPCQWRSIAPLVGRTAAQCLERYEKLLSTATEGDSEYEEKKSYKLSDIDIDPESKPALPDAVDMEEDEKEMLQEARARLACTKGKKAKRKAREKLLSRARHLAVLQKKRELKAAGIDIGSSVKKKNYKEIDYNKEIPFYHAPTPGFYDTSEEVNKPKKQVSFKGLTVEKLEGKTNAEKEEILRKKDVQRQRERMIKNKDEALQQLNKLNELRQQQIKKRTKLTLPNPQISEAELDEIAKMAYEIDEDAEFGAPTPNPQGTTYLTPAPSTPFIDKRDISKHLKQKLSSLPKPKTVKVELMEEEDGEDVQSQKLEEQKMKEEEDKASEEEMLEMAKKLVQEEIESNPDYQPKHLFAEEWLEKWVENYNDVIYLPSKNTFELKETSTATSKVESLKYEYELLLEMMKKDTKKVNSLEKRTTTYQMGYMKRNEILQQEIFKLNNEIEQAKKDLVSFKLLRDIEEKTIQSRIRNAKLNM